MDERQVLLEVSARRAILASRRENLLEGDFDSVQWRELRSVADLSVKIVCSHFDLALEDLELREAFREEESYLFPVVRVYFNATRQIPSDELRHLLLSAAHSLVSKNENEGLFQSDRFVEEGSAHLNEFLKSRGGKRVSNEFQLETDNRVVAKIHGRYAPRPVDEISGSTSCVQAVVVDTICASSRSVKLIGGRVGTLYKSDTFHFDDSLLFELAAALAKKSPLNIHFAESLDGKGEKFLEVKAIDADDVLNFDLFPTS